MGRLKALLLSQNVAHYLGGYYHEDWVNALVAAFDCDIYGPGHPGYDFADDIFAVASKFHRKIDAYDLIIATTSWDRPGQKQGDDNVDIHPRINLSGVKTEKKIYFLNKEYINLRAKLAYAQKNAFDLIVSALGPQRTSKWQGETAIEFLHLPFATDIHRNVPVDERLFDFAFSGSLHAAYIDERWAIKREFFSTRPTLLQRVLHTIMPRILPHKNWDFLIDAAHLPSNLGLSTLLAFGTPLRPEARDLRIYWAERHPFAKSFRFRDLLPYGKDYFRLLNSSRSFLCTLSAEGIFGPRFYELMAAKTVIICPRGDYGGILRDNYNCLMYDSPPEILKFVRHLKQNPRTTHNLVTNAYRDVHHNTYSARVDTLKRHLLASRVKRGT